MINRIIKLYKTSKNKDKKDWFILTSLSPIPVIVFDIYILVSEPASRIYNKANIALFSGIIIYTILFLLMKKTIKELAGGFKKAFISSNSVSLDDVSNGFIFITIVLVFISIIFVMDFSLYKYYWAKIVTIFIIIILKWLIYKIFR